MAEISPIRRWPGDAALGGNAGHPVRATQDALTVSRPRLIMRESEHVHHPDREPEDRADDRQPGAGPPPSIAH
jgi:hypothetical protein